MLVREISRHGGRPRKLGSVLFLTARHLKRGPHAQSMHFFMGYTPEGHEVLMTREEVDAIRGVVNKAKQSLRYKLATRIVSNAQLNK